MQSELSVGVHRLVVWLRHVRRHVDTERIRRSANGKKLLKTNIRLRKVYVYPLPAHASSEEMSKNQKIDRMVAHITYNSRKSFEVKRSEVKVAWLEYRSPAAYHIGSNLSVASFFWNSL